MKNLVKLLSLIIVVFFIGEIVKLKAQTRKSVSGAEVTGTFRDVSGSEFQIRARGKGKLRVSFSGVYNYKMTNGEPMANVGEARGEADISGDTAIFRPEETEQCTMTLKFLPNRRLKVMQKGTDAECGFGVNVSANGSYKKISNSRPKFIKP